MSTVLLPSIALDRLSPREIVSLRKSRQAEVPSLLKRPGTCRNLFGPVDHDELQRQLTSTLKEIAERDRLRWNFDFGEGRPLDGELEWEESQAQDCPSFYREKITTVVSKGLKKGGFAPHLGGRSPSVDVLNSKNEADKRNARKSRKSAAHVRTKRLTEMRITDFYGKRRRTGNVEQKGSRNLE